MKLWIARDPDGELKLFDQEPTYNEDLSTWGIKDGEEFFCSFVHIFNKDWNCGVNFENSPKEVSIDILPDSSKYEDGLNNPILREMSWRVDTPALLQEVANCSGQGIYSPVMAIFGRILACVAERATQLDDPILNIAMLKLKMYDTPHNLINKAIKQQLKRLDVCKK